MFNVQCFLCYVTDTKTDEQGDNIEYRLLERRKRAVGKVLESGWKAVREALGKSPLESS